MKKISKQKNINIKKTLMGGVIAGAAIAVPAITVAAGVGKIDPNQIDYTAQYVVGSVVTIAGRADNPNSFYGGTWKCFKKEYYKVDSIQAALEDHIVGGNIRSGFSANFELQNCHSVLNGWYGRVWSTGNIPSSFSSGAITSVDTTLRVVVIGGYLSSSFTINAWSFTLNTNGLINNPSGKLFATVTNPTYDVIPDENATNYWEKTG